MISTKGFYYFDHVNPKHNIRNRKKSTVNIQNIYGINNQKAQAIKQFQQKTTGIIGRSYSKKFNENNYQYIYHNRRRFQPKLTFQKLQQILSATNTNWRQSSKPSLQLNPESTLYLTSPSQNPQQFCPEFSRKNSNSFYESPSHNHNHRYTSFRKGQKNKQLKQCLFYRGNRSYTAMSKSKTNEREREKERERERSKQGEEACNLQNAQVGDQPVIYPSMSGVFIPSAKYKYTKAINSRRHKTTYTS